MFALGDVDAERLQITATGLDGAPVPNAAPGSGHRRSPHGFTTAETDRVAVHVDVRAGGTTVPAGIPRLPVTGSPVTALGLVGVALLGVGLALTTAGRRLR